MEMPLRAAIFEDDIILAEVLEDVLARFAFEVVACVGSLSQAIETASVEPFDLAVVDINLRGEQSYPLMDRLNERNIPFVIATASDLAEIDTPYDQNIILYKPYSVAALGEALGTLSKRVSGLLLSRLRAILY